MNLESLVLVAALVAGQSGTPTVPASQTVPVQPQAAGLPVSVDRIRDGLSTEPLIKPDLVNPVFRVEVIGQKPSIEDLLGKEFWKGGSAPTPGGAITHQELFAMVTPPEFRGPALFTTGEVLTILAQSLALQWAVQKASDRYERAKDEQEREAARREVRDALLKLQKARQGGLP